MVRMSGASMAPRFLDGDYLYVDPDVPAAPGRYIAVGGAEVGETTVRLFVLQQGRRVMRALAAGWPEWTLDADNETMILGVVVFAGRAVWAVFARLRDRGLRAGGSEVPSGVG